MKYAGLIALIATLSYGCAGQTAPRDRGFDVVDRCAEVLDLATNIFPPDRYSFVAEHCVAPMVSEPKCRDAVMRSIGVDASTRNTLVSGACTKAYCPRMAAPKPGLCTADLAALSPSEALPLGIEFFGEVRRVELDAAELARWDERIGAPNAPPRIATAPPPAERPAPAPAPPKAKETPAAKPPKETPAAKPPKEVAPPPKEVVPPPPKVVAPPPPKEVVPPPPKVVAPPPPKEVPPPPPKVVPPPPPKEVAPPPPKTPPPVKAPPTAIVRGTSTGEVTLRMTVRDRIVSIAVGDESWELGVDPASTAFDAAAARAVELGAREQKVVVQMGPGVQYNNLVGILNALGRQYVSNIALGSIKD